MAKSQDQNQLTEKQEYWQHHIKQWAKSGQSQAEYCRQHQIKVRAFNYFKSKLKKEILSVNFVQVPVKPVQAPLFLKLNIGSGFQVEIPDGFSQATLSKVLQVIGNI